MENKDMVQAIDRLTDVLEKILRKIDDSGPSEAVNDTILIAAQAAEILGVDNSTINYYKRSGRLHPTRIGGTDYYLQSEIMRAKLLPKRNSRGRDSRTPQ